MPRPYKIDGSKFYRLLHDLSKAFEGCTFLLLGVMSRSNEFGSASSGSSGENSKMMILKVMGLIYKKIYDWKNAFMLGVWTKKCFRAPRLAFMM
eukprot:9933161-Ditylum_brightwellii.AAC.1